MDILGFRCPFPLGRKRGFRLVLHADDLNQYFLLSSNSWRTNEAAELSVMIGQPRARGATGRPTPGLVLLARRTVLI